MLSTRSYRTLGLVASILATLSACGPSVDAIETTEAAQTSWQAPAEGTCEARGMLAAANEATPEQLDVDARLERRAAENVVLKRPFATLRQLDDAPYVGDAAMSALFAYARERGYLTCDAAEIGVVSDLDKTVIPESKPDLAKPPYPGVTALLQLLEHREGGAPGDVYYVTARSPDRVADIPAYLASHGVPDGAIETGVSGVPWVAQAEKVRDIEGIFARTGTQRFVLLGDSSHRDPEVYKEILAAHPERVIAGFIQKVNATVSPHRVEGLYLHESYAEVAAVLFRLEVITRSEALDVMRAARDEGLAITDARMDELLDAP